MLKLKLQNFGHLMRRVDPLEKTDAGRDRGQEEKGTTEDEMAGWHHWLDGHESEWTPGVGDGQGGLACCDSWGHKESDTTERLIWSDLIWYRLHLFQIWIGIYWLKVLWQMFSHVLCMFPNSWNTWVCLWTHVYVSVRNGTTLIFSINLLGAREKNSYWYSFIATVG